MSNGFGFSFPNNDDDDNDGRRDQNPFGAFGGANGGGLGDMLNQFGQMLSGMGSSMNSPENSGPVNYDMAKRIALQQISQSKAVSADDTKAVEESVRLAELWLDDATYLPTASGTAKAWDSKQWLEETMPAWQRMVTPVAEHMNDAQLESMPEEAREMMGPMTKMMNQMSGMNFGMQLGHALGDLASQALTGSDFGLPIAPANTVALLPQTIQKVARELNVPGQEVLVYIAAREAARQRLFKHVPWLVERIVSSVEEYAIGLVIDTSHLEEVTRELNLESGDPQAIQDAMSKLQGMDLSPRITSKNTAAASRLETLLALVEGWAEHVVTEALGERIPSTSKLTQAWAHRRSTGGSAENAFSKVVGIELNAPKVSEAAELWRRATVAVGAEKRDKAWDHPDFLPTAEHLDNPAAFIDSLLDEGPDEGFEEEFAKLEEMLKNGEDTSAAQGDESKESEKPEDQDDKKEKGNEDEEN
ncbi:zinc-dependent metalloprotease [Corynebacterium tuberculostearicum]|uniref:zinc-dependent metalloprotease n=1 Tax=Corynebacterium TaxID=1716 RepID=UPI001957F0CF|nr:MULTISPECIES: zinc-dependent metalloprotease [Corynebacterium]MCG7461591.1 zinc-dependent metalloprotease [Corynebacterium sp. ACRPF]MDK4230708.1 zinc-dependent metalloprotease [Corynebacterium tuberculostearicum]MDN8597631.1 zinc-dependent metalloprotease [Corynebacterium tuberculostearicum]MDV2417866.1 zinc-dependent metalloprotease [Corynebacterium tuberculostearicum]QRQ67042.1 zinc-dependent metalloprotease [Corynebacterium tuberculostearicum]